jgi:glycyl-tRNA synthetase beta chain
MSEFLLEILSEEIPARMQEKAAHDLARLLTEALSAGGIKPDMVRTYVTPRRLALVAQGMPLASADVTEEKRGPRIDAPAQAIEGFLKSTGMSLDQLERRDTGKGVFYFAVVARQGRAAIEVIKESVEAVMAQFPWPKSMRWADHKMRWVRPVQSILALFDGQVVPVSFGPIVAGNTTLGHRFLAPQSVAIRDYADYQVKTRAAKILVEWAERRHAIWSKAEEVALAQGLTVKRDDGLLDEVTGLVEWPTILMGTIDQAFMAVPPEVLITTMRTHQKYFSTLSADGELAPYFITVSNMEAGDGGAAIMAGNQRVLRARLSDAAFFWEQDRKVKLADQVQILAHRTFFQGLGSVLQKTSRVERLAGFLAGLVGADQALAKRAAHLAKADLSSGLVGEFPELQGIMGRYYALHDGEAAAVAQAIADHYSPAGPADQCPSAPVSVVLALADKIDTLVGFFAIDQKPTGSKDPYALRRAALGVIRLIVENGLRVGLRDVIGEALKGFEGNLTSPDRDLLEFFADRLKVHLRDQGVRHDLVNAILSCGTEDDLVRLLARVEALSDFVGSEDGVNLLAAYRRAVNIVRIEEKKDGAPISGLVELARLELDEEVSLNHVLAGVRTDVTVAVEAEDFTAAMAALSRLRRPVDLFFEKVTVNAENAALRTNRLLLLAEIGRVMGLVANFAAIEG